MRKIFTKTFLGICLLGLLLTGGMLRAQISLTATAGTLTGTYTDLTSAFTAINAGTHQGAITINVTASYTEPGSAVLNSNAAGAALYTSVLIQPSVDGVVISGASASGRGLIELNGADNVTINGDNPNSVGTNRNLTITNTALNTVTFTSVIRSATSTLILSADNNSVRNCIINGSATGRNISTATSTTAPEFASWGILVGAGGSTVDATTAPSAITSTATTMAAGQTALTFVADNNQINACARGISINGGALTVATGFTISNNLIGDATAGGTTTVYARGISASGFTSGMISGNTVRNMECWVSSANIGIAVGDPSTAVGTACIVERNNVAHVYCSSTGTFGAYGINLAGSNNHIVRNNCVSDISHTMTGGGAFSTTFGVHGIRIVTGTGHQIYHNTVNLFGTRPGTPAGSLLSSCLTVISTASTGMDIRNNLLTNTLTGGTTTIADVCLFLPTGGTSAMGLTLNNNAYYCASLASGGIAQTSTTFSAANLYLAANFIPGSTTPATNLRSYTSTLSVAGTNDASSYASNNAAPIISNTNLHLNLASAELVNVEQKGASGLAGVASDIDGDVRPSLGTTFPDIGCDEVAVALCTGATGGTIAPATAARCAGQTYTMSVTGASTGTGTSYQWRVGAAPGGPYVNVVGGSGATTTTYTTPALTPGVYYFVQTTTCISGPVSNTSNELMLTVTANPVVTVNPTAATYCTPGTGISITANGAVTYGWSPAAGLSAATGANVVATPAGTTTYTVTGTDAVGCTATATSVITVAPAVVASATATPGSICPNGSSTLTALGTVTSAAYCQPVYSSGTGFGDFCTLVQLGTINNATLGAPAPFYTLFPATGSTTTTLVAGTTYTITLSPGTFSSNDLAAWIDYNQSGILNDAGEKLGETDNMAAGPATTSFTFTVPVGAYNGTTRLRVREADQGTTGGMDPCVSYSFGETEDYTVTITGGVDPLIYAWSPATFLSATNTATVNATAVTTTTTYIATTTTGAGCTDTASVVLNVATSASAAPTVSTPLCVGLPIIASANATGGAPLTYVWTPNVGTTATVSVDNTVGPHSYTVNVFDACGNTAVGTLTYTVNPNPIVVATPDSSVICGGNGPIALSASGADTYAWSPATGLSAVVGTNVDANPLASQAYTVIGTDLNGCKDTTSAFVAVGQAVTIGATASANGLCSGDSAMLMITGGLPVGTYCIPTYANGTGFGDFISLVQLGSINNVTTGAPAPFYTYYPPTPTTTTTLNAGGTYTITMSPGTYTINDIAAFIDYDQNATLNDPGEKLGETDNMGAGPLTTAFTFTVPTTAYNGVTRLRVREMDHAGTNDIDPCTVQSTFGEVEDYDITIVGGLDRLVYAWDANPALSVLNNDTVLAANITGTTTFIATATSGVGCSDTASITLTLSTTPPTATCTSLPITLALDANGMATVLTTAVDSGSVDACGIDSLMLTQSTFSCADVGTNVTTLVVTNINGLSDSCNVNVTVVDNIAPTITCPANVTIPSNLCAGGAIAAWTLPTVVENCTPIITSSDSPGDTLPFGSTTVVYTVADSAGQQATCSFVVTVTFNVMNAAPTATPAAICQGTAAVLNSGVTGGVAPLTFQWSNGAGTTDPVSVSPAATTNYQVTVTDACGVTANGGITVTVNPLPVASFTAVDNQNGEATFTNTSTNATSYVWNFNPGSGTQSGASFVFIYGSAGTHTVTMIATNACGSDTATATVNVTTAVGRNLGNLNSSVYPNPNRGEFFLQLDNMGGEHVKVSITDMRGVEVRATELDITAGTHREALDISQFSKGVYFVRVRTENGSKVHKITVQ
jgi:PKD repeat protein